MRTRKASKTWKIALAAGLSLVLWGAAPLGATESGGGGPAPAVEAGSMADGHGPRVDVDALPTQIALPNGFRPEGMVFGYGPVLYAGSLADGAIYAANALTGEGHLLVEGQAGRVATGLEFDHRTGRLYVSGAATGAARVYDAATGTELAAVQLADPADGPTFINDVALTADAAYFTDSNRPVLHRMSLDDPSQVTDLPLGDGFAFQAGATNANGIVAVDGGERLILVNSVRGELYSVDPASGDATLIDLGGANVLNGDGLVVRGSTLLVIQNQRNQVAVVQLGDDPARAEVIDVLTSDLFRVPTSGDIFARGLYAVNARFGTTPGPDVDYDVVRVALPTGGA